MDKELEENVGKICDKFSKKLNLELQMYYAHLPYSVENAKIITDYVNRRFTQIISSYPKRDRHVMQVMFGGLEAKVVFDEEHEKPNIIMLPKGS